MKEITVSLYHKGCFCSEVTEKFPRVQIELASPRVLAAKTKSYSIARGLWKIKANGEKTLNDFISALKRYRGILYCEVIRRSPARALTFLKWKVETSPFELAIERGLVPSSPAVAEGGIEVYTFVAEDIKLINSVLGELKQDKNLEIVRIGNVRERADKFDLSAKQKEALQIALMHDYYNWPKRVTLDDLAHIAGVSRKVFQHNLRKAESKTIPIMIKEAMSLE